MASSSLIGGQIDLAGSGNSVGSMLAHADGSVALLMSGGEISQMTMEKAGLHLWEIFRLTLAGDKQIKLRCAVANFDVKAGDMHANTLLLDTEVTTLLGSGHIDLAQEKLDLTLNQKTKNTSPLALRSPIHISGNFAKPVIRVDPTRMAARALGALALGVINPLLALIPLIDAGPGKDSDCVPWLQGKK
jgi:AsmA protein